MLRARGYSHIRVSPAQKSNEHIPQWWGRYHPVDYGVIEGPLGSEAEYQQMNDAAASDGMQIIADVPAVEPAAHHHVRQLRQLRYIPAIQPG